MVGGRHSWPLARDGCPQSDIDTDSWQHQLVCQYLQLYTAPNNIVFISDPLMTPHRDKTTRRFSQRIQKMSRLNKDHIEHHRQNIIITIVIIYLVSINISIIIIIVKIEQS